MGPFDYMEACPPLIDLYETAESLVFKMDLPGVDPGDVLVKVFEDLLMIEGIKRAGREGEAEGEGGARGEGGRLHYICMERSTRSFRRMLRLPVPVDAAAGRALYEGGVLTVTFPKVTDRVVKIKIEKL